VNFTVLIPARLASTRLPNKPLADIAGLPMVVRVAQRAQVAAGDGIGRRVVVAADSAEIVAACRAHGVEAILTRVDHLSGSDRLAEACEILRLPDNEIVVNVQGDEPLIDPGLIAAVANRLDINTEASMSTAAHAINHATDFANPNVVKVVTDANGMALYFSRAPIPYPRQGKSAAGSSDELAPPLPLRHIGIYGYRVSFLKQFPRLTPAPIELTESLEQLRAMWHGHRIAVHIAERAPGPGVDTPEDLARVRELLGH
jgi:3-deoxy-manno-octulosonate cytidylyltransferase (CMP-KDO synthetase)